MKWQKKAEERSKRIKYDELAQKGRIKRLTRLRSIESYGSYLAAIALVQFSAGADKIKALNVWLKAAAVVVVVVVEVKNFSTLSEPFSIKI